MGNRRSDPPPPARDALHPLLAPLLVVAGYVAMNVGLALTVRHGTRPALVVSELLLVTPAALALLVAGLPLARGFALGRVGGRTLALAFAAGAAFWVGSLGLMELQYGVWPPPPGYLELFRRLHEALRPSGPADAVVSVLSIAIAPATCEELLFRGAALAALARGFGARAAVAVSALLFGLIHVDFGGSGPVLYRVPFAVAVGVGLGALRVRTGSIVPAIAAHALLNTITFLAAPLTDTGGPLPDPRPGLGAALLVTGLLGSAVVFRFLPRRPAGATLPP